MIDKDKQLEIRDSKINQIVRMIDLYLLNILVKLVYLYQI